jgi:hypothetical protein
VTAQEMARRWPPLALAAALVTGLFALNVAAAAEPFRQVKGKDIRAKFTGMEFTDEVHWAWMFGRDGKLSSVSMGKKHSGRWRIDGGMICLDPEKDGARCYQVWISGRSVQLRQPGLEMFEEGILQSRR